MQAPARSTHAPAQRSDARSPVSSTFSSPGLVLVSGEGTQAWPHLASEFESSFRAAIFSPLRGVPVEVDPWDDAKWAIGAAALVLRATFTPRDEGQADNAIRAWLRRKPQRTEVVA